jgi:hypothetical protein
MWNLTYTVRDSDSDRGTFRVNLPAATSQADVILFAQALASLVDKVTEGVVESIQATLGIALPSGLKATTVASDVEHGARLSFATASGFTTSFRLPTIKDAMLVGKEVYQADTDMAALIAGIVTGLEGVAPCDQRGSDITSVVSAVESFRA